MPANPMPAHTAPALAGRPGCAAGRAAALAGALALGCGGSAALSAAELVSLGNASLVEAQLNDGDSFKVKAGGELLHLRLYYVDCPESTVGSDAELERIREQQRHFGLAEPGAVLRFGKRAAEYVRQALSRAFTVHTFYASAPGRSATGRYYAFVETHDGRDLGRLLVERGLARIHGKTRPDPSGAPSQTVLEELQDLQTAAVLGRAGIWAEADAGLLLEMRKRQRETERERQALRERLRPDQERCDPPLDLNSATSGELQRLHGVGPVRAAQIVAGRPYRSVEELRRIPGVGPGHLARIAPCVTIATGAPAR